MSIKKIFICLFVIVAKLLLPFDITCAQPYIYYAKDKESVPPNADIYRLDIQSGKSVLFMSDVGRVSATVWNSDQTLLFVQSRSYLFVCELDNQNKEHHIANDMLSNLYVLDLNKINKVFVIYESNKEEESKTIVLDRATCEVQDTINLFSPIDNLCFSDDEKIIYRSVSDSTGFFFESIDALNYSIIRNRKRCGTLGPFAFEPGVDDAKKNKVLISFEASPGFVYQKYIVCNPDLGFVYNPISFPVRSKAYLTYDTKYVILEQVNWDTTRVNIEYRPGNVYIYDAVSGQLITQLNLPPEGEIMLFENYPDMLYYYLPSEQRSINIDLSKLTSITSLNPAIAYVGGSAFTLTVNGKNFVSGSTVNWNNTAKATTFIADSILQANILASDIVAIDSPLVTVKNPGGGESNAIRFYVFRQQNISELIDSLRAKLQQCFNQGQIGDKNFVKELDNGLENARKHLIKGDSANCAKEIDKFQNKIKKEYEKKPRSKDKRFVTEEGYRVLYNSAQAILDRLPGKK